MQHDQLPKSVQRALNQIAHARAVLRSMEERERLRHELRELVETGMSYDDAIATLRANSR